jgi:hypothetical protein
MAEPQTAVKAASALKALIQKPMNDAQRKLALAHLEDLIKCYCESRAAVQETSATPAQQQPSIEDYGVSLEWAGDPGDADTFGRALVRVQDGDGDDFFPGVAMRNSAGPCFEAWPIPRRYILTLRDLKGIVSILENDGHRLPYEG